MATSASACENMSTQKPVWFSESEIEAAEQLIQLSSGDSEEEYYSSNNSCSYSVVQGKLQHHSNKVDSGGDVASSSSSIADTTTIKEDLLAEAEDESFAPRRKNKRYRNIQDLYNVTALIKVKKMNYRKRQY